MDNGTTQGVTSVQELLLEIYKDFPWIARRVKIFARLAQLIIMTVGLSVVALASWLSLWAGLIVAVPVIVILAVVIPTYSMVIRTIKSLEEDANA